MLRYVKMMEDCKYIYIYDIICNYATLLFQMVSRLQPEPICRVKTLAGEVIRLISWEPKNRNGFANGQKWRSIICIKSGGTDYFHHLLLTKNPWALKS
jgi:hypothetical protein